MFYLLIEILKGGGEGVDNIVLRCSYSRFGFRCKDFVDIVELDFARSRSGDGDGPVGGVKGGYADICNTISISYRKYTLSCSYPSD